MGPLSFVLPFTRIWASSPFFSICFGPFSSHSHHLVKHGLLGPYRYKFIPKTFNLLYFNNLSLFSVLGGGGLPGGVAPRCGVGGGGGGGGGGGVFFFFWVGGGGFVGGGGWGGLWGEIFFFGGGGFLGCVVWGGGGGGGGGGFMGGVCGGGGVFFFVGGGGGGGFVGWGGGWGERFSDPTCFLQ